MNWHRVFPGLALAIPLFLAACSSAPTTSPGEQRLTEARNSLKNSDFSAALKNLDGAIQSADNEGLTQQAAVLRVALVTALADADKQMAEAYGLGVRQPAAQSHFGPFNKMRADYYSEGRTRLMDAMQSVMNQRAKLGDKPRSIEITFPGFMGGKNPTLEKISSGQWVEDTERLSAETQIDRNALAGILSALAGAGEDPSKGQQLFSAGKVDVDPRVYIIELSGAFLHIGDMFDRHGLNEPDHQRTVNEVVRGNLEVAMKLLAAKPDKDLEARVKKMQEECNKTLKKLGPA